MIYILVHCYIDKSALHVCGATDNLLVAQAWYNANDENDIFVADPMAAPEYWMKGIKGWRQMEMDRNKTGRKK